MGSLWGVFINGRVSSIPPSLATSYGALGCNSVFTSPTRVSNGVVAPPPYWPPSGGDMVVCSIAPISPSVPTVSPTPAPVTPIVQVSGHCDSLSLTTTQGRVRWCPSDPDGFTVFDVNQPLHFNFTDIVGDSVIELYRLDDHVSPLNLIDSFHLSGHLTSSFLKTYSPEELTADHLGDTITNHFVFFAECQTGPDLTCSADVEAKSYTAVPTSAPTMIPTSTPTSRPSSTPTGVPSGVPSSVPTSEPTHSPTTATEGLLYTCNQELSSVRAQLLTSQSNTCAMTTSISAHHVDLVSVMEALSDLGTAMLAIDSAC